MKLFAIFCKFSNIFFFTFEISIEHLTINLRMNTISMSDEVADCSLPIINCKIVPLRRN